MFLPCDFFQAACKAVILIVLKKRFLAIRHPSLYVCERKKYTNKTDSLIREARADVLDSTMSVVLKSNDTAHSIQMMRHNIDNFMKRKMVEDSFWANQKQPEPQLEALKQELEPKFEASYVTYFNKTLFGTIRDQTGFLTPPPG